MEKDNSITNFNISRLDENMKQDHINLQKGLVSIIMPAYNSALYISEAIESIQNQTYQNWELIIVDDCSTDSTYSISKKYSDKDNRIKIVCQSSNKGVVQSRNLAIKISKGQYIAFLDADDRWKKYKLEKQIKFMQENEYAFTFTAYEYIGRYFKKEKKIVNAINYQDYNSGLKNTIIGCLTVIVDRMKTGEFYMPNLKHGEDHFTWLLLMKNGFYAYGLNECLAEYRISDNSLSSNKLKALAYQWSNYRNIANLPLCTCIYYFTCYVFNAIFKRI